MVLASFALPMRITIVLSLMLLPLEVACGHGAVAPENSKKASTHADGRRGIFSDVPAKVNSKARYLIYVHGGLLEREGIRRPTDPRFGVYEYDEILRSLEKERFVVISEARLKETVPLEYATKVAGQVNSLVKAGVPPGHVTVVGASKGAIITMLASTLLKNKDVNFVIMSNCNNWVMENFKIDLYGNVLSIYDVNDEFGDTCQKFFDRATGLNRRKEVEIKMGNGHALLYRPFKEWVDLIREWAKHSK